MYIARASFEDEDQARFEKEDLVRQKPFLEDYASVEGTAVVVRCSDRQKAEEVKEVLEEITTSDRIKIFEGNEGGDGGALSKIGELFEGVQKGVRGAQKGAAQAEKTIGSMHKAPEGGMINSMFGGEQQGREVYGWASANYEEYREAEKAEELLLEKLGVPKKAIDIVSMEGIHKLTVNVSSEKKQKSVQEFLRENTDPERVGS